MAEQTSDVLDRYRRDAELSHGELWLPLLRARGHEHRAPTRSLPLRRSPAERP